MSHLWVLVAVIPLAGAALAGLGAALGLLAPRQELATLLGQLGMSAALLLGVLPAERLPAPIGWARDLLPSTYGVEALARTFDAAPDWAVVAARPRRLRGRRRPLAGRGDLGVPPGGGPVRRAHRRAWHDGRVTAPLTPPHRPPPRTTPGRPAAGPAAPAPGCTGGRRTEHGMRAELRRPP